MDYTKFIDSVVGNIARKIEDEFNENDHPRDKGGKFTSKGGEGKGSAKEEGLHHAGKDVEKFGEDLKKKRKGVIEKQKERRGKSELENSVPETETEKAAKEELGERVESTPGRGEEDEEVKAGKEELGEAKRTLSKDEEKVDKFLHGNYTVPTSAEGLVDTALEEGCEDARLDGKDHIIVKVDGEEYRLNIKADKDGDYYYFGHEVEKL